GINIPVSDRLRRENLEYTPIDVFIKKGATIITGSNMGGKTVSLKLIGQIATMAQLGLFVPAKKVKFPLRDFIYISVGDTQDMSLGLSSFAGEMVALSEIINQSDKKGLILVDELSRGTNPQEGYAISRSITDYLNYSNSISVFTSHFDGIAKEKVHYQVRGLKNMDFDSMTEGQTVIENLHHQMDFTLERVDDKEQVPKEAIPIAQMLGLNNEITLKAKEYLLQNQKGGNNNE
ncbi:MAG: DNA mismatch repair protein MutS, partial [Clostridiales bacterium]|nr:DNA mismatch repair protein MutS [Clostridiales bacterium]